MLTVGQERSTPIEIDGGEISAVTFGANGEYLVSGDDEGLRVWRVQDGKQMATTEAWEVLCVAVSKDGGWIAAGTIKEVVVWDANTFGNTFALEDADHYTINGVDFSPDSTRLVVASRNCTATVWDIATRRRALTLRPDSIAVRAAKFSPQGDRIATATRNSVRVYDSNDGCLLMGITVEVMPWYNTSLLWSSQQLFVVCDNEIKQIEASTGSAVTEWPVPDGNRFSCIALSAHGTFIAYSAKRTVAFWDTSTHRQLGLIQHPQDVHAIALSPDDQFLAITSEGGKITIKWLSHTIVSIVFHGDHGQVRTLIIPPHRIQSFCFGRTPLSNNQTFRSMPLRSIYGSTISSRAQMHY
jgi:WD40 repeat protein